MATTLTLPVEESAVRGLETGEKIYLNGKIYTARDEAHRKILSLLRQDEQIPFSLEGYGLFHCGPLMEKREGGWQVLAAGPTTSRRLEAMEPEFIGRLLPRVLIGKGGMGGSTGDALREHGGVYAQHTGGAAVIAANCVREVRDVWWLEELGMPEAVWCFEVREFGPLLVTMDSRGNFYPRK